MEECFSFSYIFRVVRLLLKYPSAVLGLTNGFENVAANINETRKKRYVNNPVLERKVNGYYISLNPEDTDSISPAIGIDGLYEPEETELLRKIVRRGDVVVDVGANVGWYTLLSAHLVENTGKVIAFEPEPSSFSLLYKSIVKNNFQNILLFNRCVSNTGGPRKLWVSKGNLGSHSIARSTGEEAVDTEAVTLDACLSDLKINAVNLLKIDVEGAEPQVFEGALHYLLGSKIKNIFLEWNHEAWQGKEALLKQVLEKYAFYRIVRSPFLIKKIEENPFALKGNLNLYLKLVE
jgi:FkbM family methyltransferase